MFRDVSYNFLNVYHSQRKQDLHKTVHKGSKKREPKTVDLAWMLYKPEFSKGYRCIIILSGSIQIGSLGGPIVLICKYKSM